VRLRILLSLLRRKKLFGPLVLDPHTMPQEASAELGEIARRLRDEPVVDAAVRPCPRWSSTTAGWPRMPRLSRGNTAFRRRWAPETAPQY
jgi:anti-sigma factor RsiW